MKYYYNNILEAGYMVENFGIKLAHYEPARRTIAQSDNCIMTGGDDIFEIEWKQVIGGCWQEDSWETLPFYVHPDSYHILEPQEGDVLSYYEQSEDMFPSQHVWTGGSNKSYWSRVVFEIIQRNGKAFIMPEIEND